MIDVLHMYMYVYVYIYIYIHTRTIHIHNDRCICAYAWVRVVRSWYSFIILNSSRVHTYDAFDSVAFRLVHRIA